MPVKDLYRFNVELAKMSVTTPFWITVIHNGIWIIDCDIVITRCTLLIFVPTLLWCVLSVLLMRKSQRVPKLVNRNHVGAIVFSSLT